MASVLALAAVCSLPVQAQETTRGDAGAFLAAKVAAQNADFAAAAEWYTRALLRDPGNQALLEGAVVANIGVGEMGAAATLARALTDKGGQSQVGHLALLAAALKAENYTEALAQAEVTAGTVALLDGLVKAWAQVGLGQMSDATTSFDALAKTKGLEAFGLYHKALALASAGDFEGADAILSGRASGTIGLMRRGVIAHAQILSQLERNPDAVALLTSSFTGEPDPELDDLRRRLAAGEPIAFDVVKGPVDGMAEVFYTVAVALQGEVDDSYALIFARVAQYLRPDHTEANLVVAGLLEALGQHDLASQTYAAVPADSLIFHAAEIGRAEATYNAGRKDAAVEILEGLTRSHANVAATHIALADAYRRDERFADALKAYDVALALLGPAQPADWALYFSRGICAERTDDFAGAEANMREALRLNPDEPRVLNYLGYSFVDRGEKLDEALGMIERAVAREPGSGYIIDSLAWAYFRLGRYADAVEPMERASLLEPVDPIVTDHLGDVYWAVGRTREAEFQWHRALSFDPQEKDAARIRKKLEIGLDAVRAEEGAPPIAPVEANANGG
jgi:tetratricopeptide (TPR) repeat protein